MTWEQFVAAVLGIAVTALVRLLNAWLPADRYGLSSPAGGMAGPPHSADLDYVEPPAETSAPPPPPPAVELPHDPEPTTGSPSTEPPDTT